MLQGDCNRASVSTSASVRTYPYPYPNPHPNPNANQASVRTASPLLRAELGGPSA